MLNKAGIIGVNVTLRRVRAEMVAVEKQWVLRILAGPVGTAF